MIQFIINIIKYIFNPYLVYSIYICIEALQNIINQSLSTYKIEQKKLKTVFKIKSNKIL